MLPGPEPPHDLRTPGGTFRVGQRVRFVDPGYAQMGGDGVIVSSVHSVLPGTWWRVDFALGPLDVVQDRIFVI